jgi:hypothetical protein
LTNAARRRQALVILALAALMATSTLADVAAAGPASVRSTEPPGLQQFMTAIAKVESGGRYHARNRRSGAYGKYQIMPRSWRGWARQYLGSANARPTPRNQELVARAKLTALYRWLRDWRLVAYWWLTGRREVRTWRWSTFGKRYVNKVMYHYTRGVRLAEAAAVAARPPVEPSPSPSGSPGADGTTLVPGGSPEPSPSPSPTPAPVTAPAVAAISSPTPPPTAAPAPSASPATTDIAQPPTGPEPTTAASPAPGRFTYQETSGQIRYRGSWIKTRFSKYQGGQARYAETIGATATVSFYGRSIAWLGPVGPGRGRAKVTVDGKPARIVNLRAGSLDPSRAVFRTSWPEPGKHTLTIEVLPAGGGTKVAIDGFQIVR